MTRLFFLSQDHDCHWYMIPADKRREWSEFLSIDPDDDRSWDVPEWAHGLGGGPEQVEFILPGAS